MKYCQYKNEKWLIYSEFTDAYVLLKEIDKNAFAIQYKRTVVNKQEISLI